MKKRNVLSVLAATALIAVGSGALASCGSTTDTFDLDMTTDTRGTTINFWTGFGTAVNDVLQPILDDFSAKTGITVNYETKGGYDALATAINLSASTTTYPNIAVGYPDHFASYIDSDIQLRLDGYIAHDADIPATRVGTATDKTDESATFNELAAFDIDDFYATYMVENRSLEYDSNGNPYTLGIPFNKSTEVMVYNKTFFDWAATATTDIKVPATWDEAKSVTDAILKLVKDKGAYGKVLGSDGNVYVSADSFPDGVTVILDLTSVTEGNLHPLSYDSTANMFITGIRQWGGEYTEMDKTTRKGYIKFQNQATYDSLSAFDTIYQTGGLGIPATFGESSYCSAHFKIYESLMNIGSSAGVSNCVPAGDAFETACAPVPYHDASEKYVISQGTNLALFDTGTAAERVASWKLLKYLSQIANGTFAAGSGYFPTCKSAAASEDYQDLLNGTGGSAKDKLNRSAALVNANSYTEANAWNKFVDPGFNGSSTIRTAVTTAPAQVFISGVTPQNVVTALYSTLQDYVRK